jgi:very-short-patch-repair endonuclease
MSARHNKINISGKRNPVKIFDKDGNLVSTLNGTEQRVIVGKWKKRHYDGNSKKKFGKSLTARPTETELVFAYILRHFQIKFNMNKPVSLRPKKKVFPDFYIKKYRWMVEVDGGYHNTPEQHEKDVIRQRELEAIRPGWTITRFTNEDVLERTELVMVVIANKINRSVRESETIITVKNALKYARQRMKEFSLENQMIPKQTRLNRSLGLVSYPAGIVKCDEYLPV